MTITYAAPNAGGVHQSNALTNYKAIYEQFDQDGINILSEGVQDVFANQVSYHELADSLTESMDEKDKAAMKQLIDNSRYVLMQESMVSGTNPVTALSLPMLRVGWPKIAVREGLPTEPVEQPKFKVTTKRPYILDKDGEKRYLPEALTENQVTFSLPQLSTEAIPVTGNQLANHDLLSPIQKNHNVGDEIDPQFKVVEVKVDIGGTVVTSTSPMQLDTNNNVFSGIVKTPDGTASATIIGSVDRAKGLLNATAIGGTLQSLKVIGYVTSERNNSATQIGFDITSEELVIGTAQPLEAPINIQHMADLMAQYQIDATLANIETMTTFLASNTDREGVNFIDETYERYSKRIAETFDVKPAADYAHGDTQWREELKAKIDRLVTRIQVSANIYSGRAVIFCNPLDAQVITNVRWVYSGVEQVNDVAIEYRLGTFVSGITNYTVIQSPYFSQGRLRVVYLPSDVQFKSLTYYPYSFTTIRGSASPNPSTVNVPSIQMIKRHLFKSHTHLVGIVEIKNNEVTV